MKKILFSALMAVMLIFVAACSGAGADSIAKKIDNHEKLSQEDYSVMISYVKEAFTDLTSLSEKYASNPQKLKTEAEELEKKYPHLEQFTQTIISASDLDASNQKKLEDLQSTILKAMGIDPSMLIQAAEAPAPVEAAPADSVN